jgi:hypothetical protein
LSVMGVAHFSLFLGGRERERERERWPKVHNLCVCLLCSYIPIQVTTIM